MKIDLPLLFTKVTNINFTAPEIKPEIIRLLYYKPKMKVIIISFIFETFLFNLDARTSFAISLNVTKENQY